MAQSRKRRSTKHRGNAAGMVEVRGRTGRKPAPGDAKRGVREEARDRRADRVNRPPTLRSAINRAAISAAVFVALVIFLFDQGVGQALGLGLFVFLFYIPLGFYTDKLVYNRRNRVKKA